MTYIAPADPLLFLEAEETALKLKLGGTPDAPAITVMDARNSARPVGVWFRSPEREFSQTMFPFIAIAFTGVAPELNREECANVGIQNYLPDQTHWDTDNEFFTQYPIPVSFSFVIEVHSRNPRHDLQIFQRLVQLDMLPLRFGYLECPTDGTIRRLDNLGWAQSDFFDSDGKRTLRKLISITVSGEMLSIPAWTEEHVETPVVTVVSHVVPL